MARGGLAGPRTPRGLAESDLGCRDPPTGPSALASVSRLVLRGFVESRWSSKVQKGWLDVLGKDLEILAGNEYGD